MATCGALVIGYCVVVLWYVATFPDIGVQCLLPEGPDESDSRGIVIRQWENDLPGSSSRPVAGDHLLQLNGRPVETFLDFVQGLSALRNAVIPPGGQLVPGSTPEKLNVPPLVEVYNSDSSLPATRQVELILERGGGSQPPVRSRVYVPVRAISVSKVALTIVWFACQLSILAVALTSFWYRPADRVARNFCLMSCAAMGAFVPGFHWWVVSVNPVLNIPFILCAGLLPAFVLNFFLVFPRESAALRHWSVIWPWVVFAPLGLLSLLLVLTYWTGWALNNFDAPDALNVFQKLAAITHSAMTGTKESLTSAGRVTVILATLGWLIRLTIGVASGYFVATVVRLGTSLFRIETPRERRQVLTILGAALLATVPIGYTLYLAYFRQVDFALGRAQLPMFVASMLFMAAYSHGMLRDRLMLAEDEADRGRRYVLSSLLVSGSFALLLATGGVMSRSYSLPMNSTTTQQISLFLILLLAAGLILWVRDRVQAVVDRRFFSEKYQLDRAMQQLNRSAAYLAEPSGMAEITLKTCQDVLDAAWSMMYVRDGQGVFRLIGARGTSSAPGQLRLELLAGLRLAETVAVRVPSVSRDEMTSEQRLLHELRGELLCLLTGDDGLHGVIILGRRRNGAAFSAEDIAFLQALAQMSVLALHSSRANQAMARLDAELKTKMDRIAEQQRQMAMLRAELTALQQEAGQAPANPADGEFDQEGIRGSSPALLEVLSQVRKVARSSATVLICGESGTGKELLARVIHRNSDRAGKSLVCVNCAALAPSLLESELFGHVKGAFTGALADKPGRFQAAEGGTLFLDEIGEITAEVQIKLLRVLQERTVEPVGSNQSVAVDVRLIAATNRNLQELIASGRFREDLFYRLNVVSVTLPPLRERPEDLAELVFCFLSRYAQRMKKQIRQIQPEALAVLEAYRWPGNIRELENVIERAVVLAESDVIGLDDLPDELRRAVPLQRPVARAGPKSLAENPSFSTVRAVARRGGSALPEDVVAGVPAADEEAQLRAALKAANGNKAVAARSLNLPRSTFFSRCRKYGIS